MIPRSLPSSRILRVTIFTGMPMAVQAGQMYQRYGVRGVVVEAWEWERTALPYETFFRRAFVVMLSPQLASFPYGR